MTRSGIRRECTKLEVRSGAGSFHVTMDTARVDNRSIILVGTVDDWASRTIVDASEVWHMLRVVSTWSVVRLLLLDVIQRTFGVLRPTKKDQIEERLN